MRTVKLDAYEIERETYEEQNAAGRYHPADVITWQGQRYTIGAGRADDVDLFTEGGALYVLARHWGLCYAGLQVFRDGEEIANVFTDLEETAGPLNDLTAINAAKRLANYGDCEGGHAAH
jgi:hypothetical protein